MRRNFPSSCRVVAGSTVVDGSLVFFGEVFSEFPVRMFLQPFCGFIDAVFPAQFSSATSLYTPNDLKMRSDKLYRAIGWLIILFSPDVAVLTYFS